MKENQCCPLGDWTVGIVILLRRLFMMFYADDGELDIDTVLHVLSSFMRCKTFKIYIESHCIASDLDVM